MLPVTSDETKVPAPSRKFSVRLSQPENRPCHGLSAFRTQKALKLTDTSARILARCGKIQFETLIGRFGVPISCPRRPFFQGQILDLVVIDMTASYKGQRWRDWIDREIVILTG